MVVVELIPSRLIDWLEHWRERQDFWPRLALFQGISARLNWIG